MMKLKITEYEDHAEVTVMDGCQLMHSYVFDDRKQARSFCQGFQCAKDVANSLIQSLPMTYSVEKAPKPAHPAYRDSDKMGLSHP